MIDKKTLISDVGMRVRILREKKKWSREQLAEYADISTQFLADIEAGKKNMTIHTLYKLAEALGTSCDYLLFNTENPNDPSLIVSLRSLPRRERLHAELILNAYIAGLSLLKDQSE